MIKDIKLPSLGEGITEGTVIALLVKKGDQVVREQSVIEIETDKVTLDVPVEIAGVIEELFISEGDVIKVGQVILKIKSSTEEVEKIPAIQKENNPIELEKITIKEENSTPANTLLKNYKDNNISDNQKDKKYRASPLAKKLARELGVDIARIKYDGSRVTVLDVKNFVKNQSSKRTNLTTNKSIQKPLPDFSKWGNVSKEKLPAIAKATLKNMQYSWDNIPHAWISEKVDITLIEKARQKHKALVKEAGGSLTITSILVKACTIALQKHPIFNSSLDVSSNEIIHKKYINIGVAVDTQRGLMVPVIRNTQLKNITEIAQDLSTLSQNAKSKKTKLEDLEGASFTISNLGGIGSTGIMPIVNSPEVGILGVGAATQEAVWNGTTFEPRLITPLTIAFDHRVINGAEALRFLKTIKGLLEDSFLMIL